MKTKIAKIREAALEGVVESHLIAGDAVKQASSWSRKKQVAVFAPGALFASLFVSANAIGQNTGCDSDAANKIIEFIQQATNFIIGIGAVGALLMLAIGAGFIIFAGGNSSRMSKGMSILKQSVIGLAVLGLGLFVKIVVTTFVQGASGESTPKCVDAGGNGSL